MVVVLSQRNRTKTKLYLVPSPPSLFLSYPVAMNVVKEIERLNEAESRSGSKSSWHDQYKHSAYIFVGNLDRALTEGDVLTVFSQFGEPVDINLVRDRDTGVSKGFCFLGYEDQRSTVLAVDNFNGTKLAGRVIRVDHCDRYSHPEMDSKDKDGKPVGPTVDVKAVLAKRLRGEVTTSEEEKEEEEEEEEEIESIEDGRTSRSMLFPGGNGRDEKNKRKDGSKSAKKKKKKKVKKAKRAKV